VKWQNPGVTSYIQRCQQNSTNIFEFQFNVRFKIQILWSSGMSYHLVWQIGTNVLEEWLCLFTRQKTSSPSWQRLAYTFTLCTMYCVYAFHMSSSIYKRTQCFGIMHLPVPRWKGGEAYGGSVSSRKSKSRLLDQFLLCSVLLDIQHTTHDIPLFKWFYVWNTRKLKKIWKLNITKPVSCLVSRMNKKLLRHLSLRQLIQI